jgi:hypothetical protein
MESMTYGILAARKKHELMPRLQRCRVGRCELLKPGAEGIEYKELK